MISNRKIFSLVFLFCFTTLAFSQKFEGKRAKSKSAFDYWEFTPKNYNGTKKFPLVIFLHGRGERGDGSPEQFKKVLTWGPPKQIMNSQLNDQPFILLAPQLNKALDIWEPELVDEFINYAISNYPVDLGRIYLTGLSMGGNGAWSYAYSNYNSPNKIAAVVAIAAWGDPSKVCRISERGIDIWAFHGVDDRTVPFESGKALSDALKSCGGVGRIENKFTTYEKTGHNSWNKAYSLNNSPTVYSWLLQHRLSQNDVVKLDSYLKKQSDESQSKLINLGLLPASLKESSGLVRDEEGYLWSHNDSGNGPYLIRIDTNTRIHSYKKITYASNMDWEDLTMDKSGNVYIGDIGNNFNIRKELFIYKVHLKDSTSERISAETIKFSYEDQDKFPPDPPNMKFDAEAMIHYKDSIFIFTKNRSEPFDGYTNIYRIPSVPGEYVAELVDSIKLGEDIMMENWVTAADISNNEKYLVLLSHSKIWLITCFEGKKFSESNIQEISLDHFSQKEAVSVTDEGTLFITDELFRDILGGNLYRFDIPSEVLNSCSE